MLKHNIIYKQCLVISNKSCLKRLKLLPLQSYQKVDQTVQYSMYIKGKLDSTEQ